MAVWRLAVAIILFLLTAYIAILLVPHLRWKHWRYEVREQEIEFNAAFLSLKVRLCQWFVFNMLIQNKALFYESITWQPLQSHSQPYMNPALDVEEAEEMRHAISRLARVAEEDV